MAGNPGTEAEVTDAALRTTGGATPGVASASAVTTAFEAPTKAKIEIPTSSTPALPTGQMAAVNTSRTSSEANASPSTPPPVTVGSPPVTVGSPPVTVGSPPVTVGSHALTPAVGSHALTPAVGLHALTPAVGLHAPTPVVGLHAPTQSPMIQQFVTLGRYQLLSRLAVGGMAEVYLARQGELSGFKTLVVVKKVLPYLAVKSDFIAMFLDEARIASLLDHPNIVRITEVGRAENEYFLAMELVQGKALAAILQQAERAKTPLPHNLSALIVANAAAGLHHAHQLTDASGNLLGLVHRDVSLQNVMVSFEGSVKVIDFGIARALGQLGDNNSGALKGKLGYMAPEQARGEPVDARADIFSLGVVLWECVVDRRLFQRDNELATLRAVVYDPIPSPSKFAEVDMELDAIVRRATARNVDERFQTADEMRVALEEWVFSSGGASTHDLATLMKSWFPSDFLQWQRAARLALDMREEDTPIDVAFPNLAATRAGLSKTGTSHPAVAGSGPNVYSESSSRANNLQAIPPPNSEAPTLRQKLWPKAAIPLAAVLSILVGGALIFFLSRREPPEVSTPETKAMPPPVRPMVETLPAADSTNEKAAAWGKRETGAPSTRLGDTPSSSERETGGSVEESTTGRRKSRSSSAEKRVIIYKKSSVPKNKSPRPNPF